MAGVAASKSTWANANNACNNKPSEGGKAWRLPNKRELVLAACDTSGARLTNANSPYWASERYTDPDGRPCAWFIDVYDVYGTTNSVMEASTYISAKCVRALSTN
ncbi:MAG: hypothetical protein LBN93_05590 [Candidatus Symbiothrix sp.]|nr:hypothetical protein [Candidatus Symbiothrix sp.]